MKGFTLIEVIVAMLILVGSAIFLLKALTATQRAIVFSDHKQKATFLLNQRIEEIKGMQWATATPGAIGTITDNDINWQIGGVLSRHIGPIEFSIIPGTVSGRGPLIGRPSISNLDIDERGITGGTFTVTCSWMEDNNKYSTITNTLYIAINRALFEEGEDFSKE